MEKSEIGEPATKILEEAAEQAENGKSQVLSPAFLIAIAAFLLSLFATFWTWHREDLAHYADLEKQLRLQLVSTADLAFKRAQVGSTLPGNAMGALNEQVTISAAQAESIANELDAVHRVTPLDLMWVSDAAHATYDEASALKFVQKAENAENADTSIQEKIFIARGYALILYALGRDAEGQKKFETALSLIDPNNYGDLANTFQMWANAEVPRNCNSAREHMGSAVDSVKKLHLPAGGEVSILNAAGALEIQCNGGQPPPLKPVNMQSNIPMEQTNPQ